MSQPRCIPLYWQGRRSALDWRTWTSNRGTGQVKFPSDKVPFDIDTVLERIREAITPYAPAALFGLSEEGFASTFEQLVACIISIRDARRNHVGRGAATLRRGPHSRHRSQRWPRKRSTT